MLKDGYCCCLNKWALDSSIKNELGLLLIISSLCAKEGYCYASNEYLAKEFNTTDVSISRKLKSLVDKNYIHITYERRGAEVVKRGIRLTEMLTDDYQFCKPTINKNVKDNNTSINNININNNTISSYHLIAEEIIEYLNQKSNKHYKLVKSNEKFIIARLEEGFTLEDFKKVIDNKVNTWKDTKYDMYLRPSTLFNASKFQGYLNESGERYYEKGEAVFF